MPTIKRSGFKTVTIKHPSGRELKAGDLKVGAEYVIDTRTGKIAPPKKAKPSKT